jgi:hypothetical protein
VCTGRAFRNARSRPLCEVSPSRNSRKETGLDRPGPATPVVPSDGDRSGRKPMGVVRATQEHRSKCGGRAGMAFDERRFDWLCGTLMHGEPPFRDRGGLSVPSRGRATFADGDGFNLMVVRAGRAGTAGSDLLRESQSLSVDPLRNGVVRLGSRRSTTLIRTATSLVPQG